MGWFRVVQDRLRYQGRLTPEPFTRWAKTNEGVATITAAVQRQRLRVFARSRARRRLWRDLESAARTEPIRSTIQNEAERFAAVMAETSYGPGLPRITVSLHRLVVVPRALIVGRARALLRQGLGASDTIAALDAPLREFFCEQLIVELDAAIGERRPSAVRPVLAREAWACVGRDVEYQWVDPIFSGPGWFGHLLMYEFPRQGLSRSVRKELDRALGELQNSLSNLSRMQRHDIIRTAVEGLPRMSA